MMRYCKCAACCRADSGPNDLGVDGMSQQAKLDWAAIASDHIKRGVKTMSVWTAPEWSVPNGFPSRTLLYYPFYGGETWAADAGQLLKWCEENS